MNKEDILFPYSKIRDVQGDMIKEVVDCIENGKHALIHAPTGLGKTVATLGPALSIALRKNLTVFFLTSRHTQHRLAIDTLKDIKKEHGTKIISCDIIGKQWMCGLDNVDKLFGNEFNDYCKKLREDNACEFYTNTKKKSGSPTVKALKILDELK